MTLVRRLTLAVTACGLAVTAAQDARAQSAGAEALFREGRAQIKLGQVEAGCDKLAASERLESSVGTLLNLGDCREKLGKTASAWAAFRKAEAMAKRAGDDKRRQAEARRRAEALESDLSRLVLQIGPAGKATPGLVIKRNGERLDAAVLDTPVPIDPGTHTIVAEAPGYESFETEVSIGKGGKRYVVIPTLERIPEPIAAPSPARDAPPAAPPATIVIDPEPAPTPTTITVRDTWNGTRKAAVGVGIVGALAIGGGIYAGTRAKDLEDRSDAICPETTCGDPEGLRLNDDAQDNALAANILFIAGGAAVATATVLWFVGQPDERTVITPTVSSDQVGAALVGRF